MPPIPPDILLAFPKFFLLKSILLSFEFDSLTFGFEPLSLHLDVSISFLLALSLHLGGTNPLFLALSFDIGETGSLLLALTFEIGSSSG